MIDKNLLNSNFTYIEFGAVYLNNEVVGISKHMCGMASDLTLNTIWDSIKYEWPII